MSRLAWDICRCMGAKCERKTECARHEQLSNMGPRTPVMDRCCDTAELKRLIPIFHAEPKP